MPRYFFHRTDGYVEHDLEGTELESRHAARVQAVIFAGASLQEDPKMVWAGEDFRVEVSDDTGTILFSVVVQAIDSPAVIKALKQT